MDILEPPLGPLIRKSTFRANEIAVAPAAIVAQYARLHGAHLFRRNRHITAAVEPKHVDFSVARQQFRDLTAAIGALFRVKLRRSLLRRARLKVYAHLFIARKGHIVLFHAPVRRRIVQPHAQPVPPAGRDELPHQIAPLKIVLRIEIAVFARPERKAVVVLRGQYGVLKPRLPRGAQPLVRIVMLGAETLRLLPVFPRRLAARVRRQAPGRLAALIAVRLRAHHAP